MEGLGGGWQRRVRLRDLEDEEERKASGREGKEEDEEEKETKIERERQEYSEEEERKVRGREDKETSERERKRESPVVTVHKSECGSSSSGQTSLSKSDFVNNMNIYL